MCAQRVVLLSKTEWRSKTIRLFKKKKGKHGSAEEKLSKNEEKQNSQFERNHLVRVVTHQQRKVFHELTLPSREIPLNTADSILNRFKENAHSVSKCVTTNENHADTFNEWNTTQRRFLRQVWLPATH